MNIANLVLAASMLTAGANMQSTLTLPAPHPGTACHFGSYLSAPIGFPISVKSGTDIPGPHGNEVKQIYRIFYARESKGKTSANFAGWLYATLDGKYAFAIGGLATTERTAPLWLVEVTPSQVSSADHLPLSTWVRTLLAETHVVPDATMQDIMSTTSTSTAAARCFSYSWSGKE